MATSTALAIVGAYLMAGICGVPGTPQYHSRPELLTGATFRRQLLRSGRTRPRPTRAVSQDLDEYSWGTIGYTNGRVDQIDYQFKARASSIKEALAKVGLEQTSAPTKGPFSYYWNDSTGSLVCCGFEMDNVVISADFSGISVGFKRKINSPGKK